MSLRSSLFLIAAALLSGCPEFPEISCTRDSDCNRGICSDFRCVENGEPDASEQIDARIQLDSTIQDASTRDASETGADAGVEPCVGRSCPRAEISGFLSHLCAAYPDGSAACWGYRAYGPEADRDRSVPVFEPLSNVKSIMVGYHFVCALLGDERIHCSGWNETGQLGRGFRTPEEAQYAPVSNIFDATELAVADRAACALLRDGTVDCWGGGRTLPSKVVGLSDVVKISAGGSHACALRRDETVKCWNLRATQTTDVSLAQVVDISTSNNTSCAVVLAGHVFCWDHREMSSPPQRIQDLQDIEHIDSSSGSMCAIDSNGLLYCWGRNTNGLFGNYDLHESSAPVLVPLDRRVLEVALTATMACVVAEDSSIRCWGENLRGQLGADSQPPFGAWQATLPGQIAEQVAIGRVLGCAVTADGRLFRWGEDESPMIHQAPAEALLANQARSCDVSADNSLGCVLSKNGDVQCWGHDLDSIYPGGAQAQFARIEGLPPLKDLAVGADHVCGVSVADEIWCWGNNELYQLGREGASSTTPTKVEGVAAVEVDAGYARNCFLTDDGRAFCWGLQSQFIHVSSSSSVAEEISLSAPAEALTLDTSHACALTNLGDVHCWTNDGSKNVDLVYNEPGLAQVLSSNSHKCVVSAGSELKCRGANTYGLFGTGSSDDEGDFADPPLRTDVRNASASTGLNCIIDFLGDVYCIGRNLSCALGVCEPWYYLEPQRVLAPIVP